MSKPFTTESFTQSANIKFNYKFDYSKVVYKNANTLVTIGCPDHGDFTTTPWNHIKSLHGCAQCGVVAMAKKQREQTRKKFIEFVSKSTSGYDYTLVTFDKITDKVKVICPKHGEFSLTLDHHMRGVGCKKCADQNKTGGYSEEWFDHHPNRKRIPGMLYVLEMFSSTERFIKIGITKNDVKKRYAGSKYQYSTVKLIYNSLYECYRLEKLLKDTFKSELYLNDKKIHITESFNFECRDKILEMLDNH